MRPNPHPQQPYAGTKGGWTRDDKLVTEPITKTRMIEVKPEPTAENPNPEPEMIEEQYLDKHVWCFPPNAPPSNSCARATTKEVGSDD